MNRPWMPLYVGDFIADTMHLGATETGIYIRLIMHCWQHGTIPRAPRQLALIAHCDSRLWRQYEATVLQFFDVVDASTAHHKRVTSELRRSEEISNKRKASAEQKHSKSTASDVQLHTHARASSQSQSQSQEQKEIASLSPSLRSAPAPLINPDWPKDFRDAFWRAYPRKVGKKDAIRRLEQVWRTDRIAFPALLAAIGRIDASEPQFIPYPATWLNRGSHLDGDETGTGPPDWVTEATERVRRERETAKAKANGTASTQGAQEDRPDAGATGGTDHQGKLLAASPALHRSHAWQA